MQDKEDKQPKLFEYETTYNKRPCDCWLSIDSCYCVDVESNLSQEE